MSLDAVSGYQARAAQRKRLRGAVEAATRRNGRRRGRGRGGPPALRRGV